MRIARCTLKGRSGHDAGRELLARLYREETGEALPDIAVTNQGKPYFPGSSLHFSISHTPDHAFCALSQHPVGIDAEELTRNINLKLADKILSPSERMQFDAAENKEKALLTLWVLKEAAAKLCGEGLRGYPNHTDFSPDDPALQIIDGCFVAVIEE